MRCDAITDNVDHTLTWDVAADWDVNLGQVKFEVLAMDGRGLLPFDWITIPAADNSPTNSDAFNALFCQYASGVFGLSLQSGRLFGSQSSGVFADVDLVIGLTDRTYATPFIFKCMGLDPANIDDMQYANVVARAGLTSPRNQWLRSSFLG